MDELFATLPRSLSARARTVLLAIVLCQREKRRRRKKIQVKVTEFESVFSFLRLCPPFLIHCSHSSRKKSTPVRTYFSARATHQECTGYRSSASSLSSVSVEHNQVHHSRAANPATTIAVEHFTLCPEATVPLHRARRMEPMVQCASSLATHSQEASENLKTTGRTHSKRPPMVVTAFHAASCSR
jgi:hypothetical protein